MSDRELSQELQDFLSQFISSVVQLELLLLLSSGASRAWSAEELARELRIDAGWAATQAKDLCARGLLLCDERSSQIFYRYAPQAPEVQRIVEDLARTYNDRRVSIISFIYSRPPDQLRSFADAFRLRKDQDRG